MGRVDLLDDGRAAGHGGDQVLEAGEHVETVDLRSALDERGLDQTGRGPRRREQALRAMSSGADTSRATPGPRKPLSTSRPDAVLRGPRRTGRSRPGPRAAATAAPASCCGAARRPRPAWPTSPSMRSLMSP